MTTANMKFDMVSCSELYKTSDAIGRTFTYILPCEGITSAVRLSYRLCNQCVICDFTPGVWLKHHGNSYYIYHYHICVSITNLFDCFYKLYLYNYTLYGKLGKYFC